MLEVADDGLRDLLPSFRSGTAVVLDDLRSVNEDVATAAVLDQDGEQLTSASLELEQRRLLPRRPVGRVRASLTALGVDVHVFPDARAFASSDASLLDPDSPSGDPPAEWASDWPWPARVAASSFFSYGVFADPAEATAHARLAGEVLHAERRVVQATGQEVVVVQLESAVPTLTVCLEGAAHPQTPTPGSVLAGTVFLTASLDELPAPRRRLWSIRG